MGGVLIGGYIYWRLEPGRHFENTQVPILATPAGISQSSSMNPVPLVESTNQPTVQSKQEENEVKSFNVLVLGIDARGEENSRSDVIMVVHVMPKERKANIVSLPRDMMVNINGIGNTKINHAHILGELKGGNRGGTEEVQQVVSDFLDIPINYFIKTNFVGFKNFIDTIGGVDVEVKQDIYLRKNNKELLAGIQHIDGDMALSLVRERWAFPEGDFGRQNEQSKILRSVAKELLAPEHIIETTMLLTKVKKDVIDSNFTDSDLLSLARMLQGMTEDDFQYKQIPGHSSYDNDPLMQMRLYYWIPDQDKVKLISKQYLK